MIRSAILACKGAFLLVLFSLLTACAEEQATDITAVASASPTPTPYPTPRGYEAPPPGDRTLAGIAAYGAPAAFAEVCVVGGEHCTRADSLGHFVLTPVAATSGYLSATYLAPDGQMATLYSYFDMSESPYQKVHIHPTTDIITRLTTQLECGQDLPDEASNCPLPAQRIDEMTQGLGLLLGSLWPQNRDPFYDDYIANPKDDSLDRLNEVIRYELMGETVTVYDQADKPIAQATAAQLVQLHEDNIDPNIDLVDDSDADGANSNYKAISPSTSYQLASSILPTIRQAPVEMTAQIKVFDQDNQLEAVQLQFTLLYYNGASAQWQQDVPEPLDSNQQMVISEPFWLTEPGKYVLITDLQVLTGEGYETVHSIDDIIDIGANYTDTSFHYGAEGSCYQPAYVHSTNFYYCYESANGVQYASNEQDNSLEKLCRDGQSEYDLIIQPGQCPNTSLHGGDYLGACTLDAGLARMHYYTNGRQYPTASDALSTAESECLNSNGTWLPAL